MANSLLIQESFIDVNLGDNTVDVDKNAIRPGKVCSEYSEKLWVKWCNFSNFLNKKL